MIALLVRLVPFVFFPFECFAAAATASALRVGEPVEGTLAFGTAQSYALALHAGDYVEATLEEHGSSGQILVLAPNGSRSRKFNMDGAKRKFAFVADADGPHTIQLRTEVNSGRAGEKAGTFGLRIDRVLPLSERMRLGTGRTPYAVPEIAALQRELPSPGATERFWRHVAEVGTPLVTPIADDEAHQLATFLWRGDSTTQNVVVIGPSDRPITDYLMDHIPDTDVWRLTLKLPAGARFAYTLSINDPLVLEGPRAAERAATQQADPLNPKKSWNYAPGAGIHEYSSMAELPGAPSQPWILKRPGVPEGKVEHMPFKSDLLGNERKITVYTPAGYQKGGGPFDLLVLFDENAYIDRVPTPTILDNRAGPAYLDSAPRK